MVKKKTAIGLVILVACVSAGLGGLLYYLSFFTLPLGQDPSLTLPFSDTSHLHIIQGFGQVTPTRYHNGIDFSFNDTTQILASHGGLVLDVKFWYNERGGHWQTNVRIQLNFQWMLEIAFESWATMQPQGQLQADAITVKAGTKIQQDESIGNLVCHGEGCHIHFGLRSSSTDVCPYPYFSAPAKTSFDALFAILNGTLTVCA
nr:hypothetical protein [Candidatus Sigynarchaeota archaeon]